MSPDTVFGAGAECEKPRAGVQRSTSAGFKHLDVCVPHRCYRFPEDEGLPLGRRPSVSCVILLDPGDMGILTSSFVHLEGSVGDNSPLIFSWGRMLAERCRTLGFEPLLLAGPSATEGEGPNFCWELCMDGLRVCPRRSGASLWQNIQELVHSDAVLLFPAIYPLCRISGIRILLKEFLLRAVGEGFPCPCGLPETFDGLRPQAQDIPGWPVLLSSGCLDSLARSEDAKLPMPTLACVDTADDNVVFSAANTGLLDVETRSEGLERLSSGEALRLLACYGCPERGLRHARAVGEVAFALASLYHDKGRNIDPDLARAGGFLHDIAKGYRRHEQVGGILLGQLGLRELAVCVKDHSDIVLEERQPVTERELVYLADKYCRGPRFVPLAQRFGEKMEFYACNCGAVAGIRRRLGHAQSLESRIIRELGVSPETIARKVLGC